MRKTVTSSYLAPIGNRHISATAVEVQNPFVQAVIRFDWSSDAPLTPTELRKVIEFLSAVADEYGA